MVVGWNSGKVGANTESCVAVERQSCWSRYIAYDLRHVGL